MKRPKQEYTPEQVTIVLSFQPDNTLIQMTQNERRMKRVEIIFEL